MNPTTNPPVEGIVILHFGPAPMDFLSKAAKLAGRDAVVDPQAAQMAGAVIAAGPREALDALKARLTAGSIEHAKGQTRGLGLPAGAAEWLGAGERGISSNTMFTVLTGVDAMSGYWRQDHPYDPSDFRRCRLLLEAVPALAPLLPNMRNASPQWAALVDAWEDICRAMNEEAPNWRGAHGWNCPRTYELIKKAIGR